MTKTKNKESYLNYEKAIALVSGIMGIALLASSRLNLTGGVIGTEVGKNLVLGLIGSILLICSLVFLMKKPKKK